MADKHISGIPGAMASVLKSKTEAETIELVNNAFSQLARTSKELNKTKAQIKVRNGAGARRRAEKYLPLKKSATELHDELKRALGKNPPWKIFIAQLEAKYPDAWKEGKDGGINDWWKKLNKNKSLY